MDSQRETFHQVIVVLTKAMNKHTDYWKQMMFMGLMIFIRRPPQLSNNCKTGKEGENREFSKIVQSRISNSLYQM